MTTWVKINWLIFFFGLSIDPFFALYSVKFVVIRIYCNTLHIVIEKLNIVRQYYPEQVSIIRPVGPLNIYNMHSVSKKNGLKKSWVKIDEPRRNPATKLLSTRLARCHFVLHYRAFLSLSPVWIGLGRVLDQAGRILQGNQPQWTAASGLFRNAPLKELTTPQQRPKRTLVSLILLWGGKKRKHYFVHLI